MERIKKSAVTRFKDFFSKISEDNLTLLSSSVSYYSALALAPFMLILLATASLLGQDIQQEIVRQAEVSLAPEVGSMIRLIFQNLNETVNIGSISGILGLIILLSTASLVFLQFRHAFDVIYGHYDPVASKSFMETIKERLFFMLIVVGAALLFILSISLSRILELVLGKGTGNIISARFLIMFINLILYQFMFMAIHYFAPSIRPKIKDVFKISLFSSCFFLIGNILLASYLRGIASNSIYGAAATLLVFLIWANYSSFTVFLSAEVFLFLKKIGKIK